MKQLAYSRKVLLLGILVVVCVITYVLLPRYAGRMQCQRTLRAIKWAVDMYCNDNHGQYPPNLDVLVQVQLCGSSALRCPNVNAVYGKVMQTSYSYINWSVYPHGSDWGAGKYPVIYDSSFANHRSGVNIVMTDGTIMWDSDVQWLKQFASQHPKIQILIPTKKDDDVENGSGAQERKRGRDSI